VAAEEPVSPNVDALAKIIDEMQGSFFAASDMARHLASRGVLATEALTDEQCEAVFEAMRNNWDEYEIGKLPAALARLARGEG
jgi:hypothetical protein